jgi:hypothetical protein
MQLATCLIEQSVDQTLIAWTGAPKSQHSPRPYAEKGLSAAGRRTVLSALRLAAIQGIKRYKDAADLVR